MDYGTITLALVVLGFIGWLTFVITNTRVRRRREEPAQNQSEYLEDDVLEGNKLTRVLVSALVTTGVLAIVMPIYYLNESSRQVHAAETFDEIAVERGEHWFSAFQCGDCHGASGAGGGAAFIEPRSGIETTWAAPSLNDVTYRFTDDEIRHWIVYGRPGTPMPAWGVEGGGPLNEQQVDELLAYIEHFQISQSEVVDSVEGRVTRELSRLEGADDSVQQIEESLQDDIARIAAAAPRYEVVGEMPARLNQLLSAPGTCTSDASAVVDLPCDEPGADSDRDGVSDAGEAALNALVGEMLESAPAGDARSDLEAVMFDPANRFTTSVGPTPIPDLDQVETVAAAFESIEREVRLSLDNRQALLDTALSGLEYVEQAAEQRRWAIDFEEIAAAEFDGNITEAQRAGALYNAYCARCHTSGYSAGVTFTQEAGSGGFGPSLRDGRSMVQFPDIQAHYDFVVNGSAEGVQYGVNGIGRGWMPGFGALLSQEDIMRIVRFERALR